MKMIAEFCQNHNGDFDVLARMIESAAKSGATHGKIQMIYAKNLSFRPQFEEGLIQNNKIKSIKRPYKNEYNRLKKLELNEKHIRKFIDICNNNGIKPMTTCFVRSDINKIKNLGFKKLKIASYDCASYPMLKETKKKFSEIFISTGAMFDDEITHATKIMKNSNFSLLHCVTIYPTPLKHLNLARMKFLKRFSKFVGFSDHTLVSKTKLKASKCAIYMGANIIERHFSILDSNETKDGPISINASQLKELSEFSRLDKSEQLKIIKNEFPEWKQTIGNSIRHLSDEELLNRDYYRGRFASLRSFSRNGKNMIYNWEDIDSYA